MDCSGLADLNDSLLQVLSWTARLWPIRTIHYIRFFPGHGAIHRDFKMFSGILNRFITALPWTARPGRLERLTTLAVNSSFVIDSPALADSNDSLLHVLP